LYHMNAHGRVVCLDAQTGREEWAVDILERFGGEVPTWGLSECLLVDGDHVIVTPGGRAASLAALDRRTGRTVWTAAPLVRERDEAPISAASSDTASIEIDSASYASPVLLEGDGFRMLVTCSARHVFAVSADTGRHLWKRPIPTRFQVIGITPTLLGEGVFVTAPDSPGGKLYRLLVNGASIDVEEAWTADIDTCHGGVLAANGLLFGSWYRHYNGWGAVDPQTGKTLYRTKELAMGAAIYADGLFYCLSQEGNMALVKANASAMHIVSQFQLTSSRRKDVWTHPVILDGRLYLRYHEELICYDIRRPAVSPTR